ncbi:CLUMA_CG011135, isoform A [Clunio marinus]|uniref:CLUMA_CG011135, isoform A n=1 Tax=Clunio marinus TaxID=568069 RepID=A0A1J1IC28_9DIPT|nr:CLUMA_CG011135, isoform A [Clunio marinus]
MSIHSTFVAYGMKFIMLFVALFAFICSAMALTCTAGLKDINGVCGVQRPVHGECPNNTKFDINKNLCVAK